MQRYIPETTKLAPIIIFKEMGFFFKIFSVIKVHTVLTEFAIAGPILKGVFAKRK